MVLTADVKGELTQYVVTSVPSRSAEVATILRFSGGLHLIGGRIAVESELDNVALVHRVRKNLAEIYGAKSEVSTISSSSQHKGVQYIVRVVEGGETLARQTGLLDARRRPTRGLPNKLAAGSPAILEAVWRGAFLAQGSLSAPGRSAVLEILCPKNEAAMALVGAANRISISAKAREVRGVYRVVIRDDEAISAMLTRMGAVEMASRWDQLRARREVRATANRLVNFDDANLRRSAQAAVVACARVERAMEILGENIPEHLRYAGALRLDHREASLDELGQRADPPLTKDAVAGRIRRLLALADKRALEQNIPGTESNLPEEFSPL